MVFDQPVQMGSGRIGIRDTTTNDIKYVAVASENVVFSGNSVFVAPPPGTIKRDAVLAIKVDIGTFRDLDGSGMHVGFQGDEWTFSTSPGPVVIATYPPTTDPSLQIRVPIVLAQLRFTFTEPVTAQNGAVTIRDRVTGSTVSRDTGSADISINGAEVTVTLPSQWASASTAYTVTVANGAFADTGSANLYGGLVQANNWYAGWSFDTSGTPFITSTTPVSGSTSLVSVPDIQFTFDSDVTAVAGGIIFFHDLDNDEIFGIDVEKATITGKSVVVKPEGRWQKPNTNYAITIMANSFTSGTNSFVGYQDTNAWVFKTSDGPLVRLLDPPNDPITPVVLGNTIHMEFNTDIGRQPGTSNASIQIVGANNNVIEEAQVPTNEFTITGRTLVIPVPPSIQKPSSKYVVVIPPDALNDQGNSGGGSGGSACRSVNPLTTDAWCTASCNHPGASFCPPSWCQCDTPRPVVYVGFKGLDAGQWNFLTVAGPVVTSLTPSKGAEDVPINTQRLKIVTDKAMLPGSGTVTIRAITMLETAPGAKLVVSATSETIVFGGTEVVINLPGDFLRTAQTYEVTVTKGTFKELDTSVQMEAINASDGWRFTTAAPVEAGPCDTIVGTLVLRQECEEDIIISGSETTAVSTTTVAEGVTPGLLPPETDPTVIEPETDEFIPGGDGGLVGTNGNPEGTSPQANEIDTTLEETGLGEGSAPQIEEPFPTPVGIEPPPTEEPLPDAENISTTDQTLIDISDGIHGSEADGATAWTLTGVPDPESEEGGETVPIEDITETPGNPPPTCTTAHTTPAAYPHVKFSGRRYALLDGSDPHNVDPSGCQVNTRAVPAGWRIAKDTALTRAVISEYDWGTSCVVLANGVGVTPELESCGSHLLKTEGTAGTCFFLEVCPSRVLIEWLDPDLTNLIENPSFEEAEDNASGGDVAAKAWDHYGSGYNVKNTGFDGTSAICTEFFGNDESNFYSGAQQTVQLLQEEPRGFHISAWSSAWKITGDSDVNYVLGVEVIYMDDSSEYFDGWFETGIAWSGSNNHDWQKVGFDVKPRAAIKEFTVYLKFNIHTGRVCFDDVRTGPLEGNLLFNPTMARAYSTVLEFDENGKVVKDNGRNGFLEKPTPPQSWFWEVFGDWGKYEMSVESSRPSSEGYTFASVTMVRDDTAAADQGASQLIILNNAAAAKKVAAAPLGSGETNADPVTKVDGYSLYVGGWSKAEGVSGVEDNDYAISVDIDYTDGTGLYGQSVSFSVGSHGWEYKDKIIAVDKPIESVRVTAVFRRKHTGQVWFDNFSLIPKLGKKLAPLRGSFGDPYITTFDNEDYELQTTGEYILANDKVVQVQVRYSQMGKASVCSAIAVRGGGVTVELSRAPSGELPKVKVDGVDQTSQAAVELPGGVGVIIRNIPSTPAQTTTVTVPFKYTIVFNTGHKIVADVRWNTIAAFFETFISYPQSSAGQTTGLMGNFDGVTGNDFGADVCAWASQFRLTNSSPRVSLFSYAVGQNENTAYDSNFGCNTVTFADFSQSQITAAEAACSAEGVANAVGQRCVMDVLYTGDVTMAVGYSQVQAALNRQLAVTATPTARFTPTGAGNDDDDSKNAVIAIVFGLLGGLATMGLALYRWNQKKVEAEMREFTGFHNRNTNQMR
eukprot:GFYU01001707.1.p1 GENE.GFYU01001707.1~~GFYU01001707.1.p1  ORF type:complete len:1898 (-),score=689.12 GFYU01001707.1:262-5172(-)